MKLKVRELSGVQVAELEGRFDAHAAAGVKERLDGLLARGGRLVVDMAAVDYMSSAGLRVLLSLLKHAQPQGGDVRLSGLQDYVQELFEVAGFTDLFEIYPSAEQAAASFRETL